MQTVADDSLVRDDAQVGLIAGEQEPEELDQAELARQNERRIQLLENLAVELAKDRSDAISARESSGIEDIWAEDEEFYQGIDEANRGEHKASWRTKPMGQAVSASKVEDGATRSTVFPNVTGPYVDAASARISDMLLPTDDRSWGIKQTPIPELVDASKGKYSRDILKRVALENPGAPDVAKNALAQATQEALQVIAEAKESAERAQTRIEDWHVQCQYHSKVRQVIEDSARIGVGVLKGPVPMLRKRVAWKNGQMVVEMETFPGSEWVDPWDFYPSRGCGEDIHKGSGTWERIRYTKKQMRELKEDKDGGWLPDQIDACLEEGPRKAAATYRPIDDTEVDEASTKTGNFEGWIYHGVVERNGLEAAGCECDDIEDPHVPAMIVMVNNRIIKGAVNPMSSGDFPYDVMVWRRRIGHWAGIGVARQIRTAQRIVTAATRNLMDNAGLAGGPMLVFRQGVVEPANGIATLAPRKVWYISEDADEMVDATKAIGAIKVDMLVTELMQIIQLGLKFAEDVTGLPMLLQGQQGKAPDTVGGMQILNNNASSVLRRLARLFDDKITEPHIRRYYEFLLEYGHDDSEKGDFTIDARGSSALVERDIQNQELAQLGNLVLNPVFGKDPKKWMDEYLKSRHLDVNRFNYDDDQWQQIVASMSQGKQDPRLAVAQLRAETDAKLKQMDQAFDERENARDRELQLLLSEIESQAKAADQTVEVRKVLDGIKGKLGDTMLKINGQRQMQREEHAVQLSKPAVEPAGRAKPGDGYVH